jgi:hypothetical protein
MTDLGLTTASVLVTATRLYPDNIDCIIYQDMVDTTPFSQAEPFLHADLIIKVVLGAINATTRAPPIASPLQPYPVQATQYSGRSHSPRPESPAQNGKTASGWSFPQAPPPESPLPVQKTFKTFLQWKAAAQATTADYQRNGFSSPAAWVLLFITSPSHATYVPRRYV